MNNQQRRPHRGRLAAALLGGLLCLLLCSCSGCNGLVQSCAAMQSWFCPQLVSSSDISAPPVITHSPDAEEVTAQLDQFYAPIVRLVDTANQGQEIFSLEHELTVRDGSYYLQSDILCQPEGTIELPEIYIPYFGETVMPEYVIPDGLTGEGTDSLFTAAWLELTANGIPCDPASRNEPVSAAQMLEVYHDYYTQVSGLEVDLSRFADSVQYDTLQRQAMVLGLIDYPERYESPQADTVDLTNAASGLLAAMYYDACGCGTQGFTMTELLECIKEFVLLDIYPEEEWSKSAQLIVRLCDERLAALDPEDDHKLLREELADLFIGIYETMYGKVSVEDYYYDYWLEDTDSDTCIKANWLGIMPDFPKEYLFAGHYIPGRRELPGFVEAFVSSCRSACLGESEQFGDISRRDVMVTLSLIDRLARKQDICQEEPVIVNNSRDYDWYYTQHETGYYSLVNCMPTIAMMATKWYDQDTTVTIEEMRMRYLPDYPGGWYTWQVAECLDRNGIPNEQVEINEDKLEYLDEGKIILSQMSEAAVDASGHCFVIYGYWKRGDSVKYFVHDPDVYDGTDEYGRRPGYAMVMDGRYCDWIIDRIAFNYIVVGD